MVQEQPRRGTRRRRAGRRAPRGMVSLAQRAQELGMTVASLRRYVNIGEVEGQTSRLGSRIYVARDMVATPRRTRRGGAVSQTEGRRASLRRDTGETRVNVEINLDGSGRYQVQTSDPMLDHLLAQLAKHGLLDLVVTARGDSLPDGHHLFEDVAITLGRALRLAIGEGRGIRRMGSALVPLDEALAEVAVDVSGRGYAVLNTGLDDAQLGNLSGTLVAHFLERLALEGSLTLNVRVLSGSDSHHKAEAIFKALARALRTALEIDPRSAGEVPSTKGTVSG